MVPVPNHLSSSKKSTRTYLCTTNQTKHYETKEKYPVRNKSHLNMTDEEMMSGRKGQGKTTIIGGDKDTDEMIKIVINAAIAVRKDAKIETKIYENKFREGNKEKRGERRRESLGGQG